MQDKTQNIFINWKFNTAPIDQANVVLNRANEASNKLQAAGQKAGQALAQGYQKAVIPIERMNIELARLKTQIQVSSDPKRIAELSNQYRILAKEIDAANKKAFGTAEALKSTGKATQSTAGSFGQLYQAAKLVLTAGIVREVFDMSLSMAELSGNVEGVERAFNRAFPNSIKILDDLQKATHNTVTDFELMQRTLQATNLGVEVSKLPVLFEFAAARAQQTGESVDSLVDSIVRGIGRKSPLILDNLGLSAIRLKKELGGVSLQAASVGQVTEVVGRIAQEELTKMGGYAENSATKVKRLKADVEELKVSLAKKLTSNVLIDSFQFIAEGFKGLVEGEQALIIAEDKRRAGKQIDAIVNKKEFTDLKGNQAQQIDFLIREIIERQRLVRLRGEELRLAEEKKQAIRDDLTILDINAATEGINSQIQSQKESKRTLEESIPILTKYIRQLQDLAALEEEDAEPSGIISRKKKEIEELSKQIELTNDKTDLGFGGTLLVKLEILQAELGDLQRTFHDFKPLDFEHVIGTDAIQKQIAAFDELPDKVRKSFANIAASFEKINEIVSPIKPIKVTLPITVVPQPTFLEELRDSFLENWKDITVEAIDINTEFINGSLEAEVQNLQQRLKHIKSFYNEQEKLAGDNDRAKSELRIREERETAALQKKIFEKEKELRKRQIIMDSAGAVAKAFVTYAWPYSLIVAGMVALKTIAQLNVVNRQSFAEGVIDLKGPGTEKSDSIPANLSRGESVMTAWETKHAGNVLKEIRAKKLDDKVLKNLKQGRAPVQQNLNLEPVIKAIKENRPPDVIEQSGIVYKAQRKSDDYIKKVRACSVKI